MLTLLHHTIKATSGKDFTVLEYAGKADPPGI